VELSLCPLCPLCLGPPLGVGGTWPQRAARPPRPPGGYCINKCVFLTTSYAIFSCIFYFVGVSQGGIGGPCPRLLEGGLGTTDTTSTTETLAFASLGARRLLVIPSHKSRRNCQVARGCCGVDLGGPRTRPMVLDLGSERPRQFKTAKAIQNTQGQREASRLPGAAPGR
jgi:hypothetical protein